MGRTTRSRLRAAATGLTAGFALLGTADALAATVDGTGGTLTYTASPGTVSNLFFSQSGSEVTVSRNTFGQNPDDDPFTAVTGSCTTEPSNSEVVVCTGITSVVADAGDGNDELSASGLETIPTNLRGGAGRDGLTGGGGNDTINGGDGDDFFLGGGGGDDTLNGGAGRDFLSGASGNDTVNGDADDDSLSGGTGTDAVNGGGGDDFIGFFELGPGPGGPGDTESDNGDVSSGGDGLDTIIVVASPGDGDAPVSVTLDDQANDGAAGEGDNVRSDIEAVFTHAGADTIVGSDGTNSLVGGEGNDAIDGGRGNDVLRGEDGDDTITSRDGFADFVTCGVGNDTANVDTLDTVSSDCETVNRQDVGNANEDRPPVLTVTGPGDNAAISTKTPTTYTANVTDDRGISQVLFLANGRLVCADTVAPYTCAYQPTGADIGRTAVTVVAVDSSQQTATVIKSVTVGRFAVRSFTSKLTPSRDTSSPYRFTMTGKVNLPSTVTAAQGCKTGIVSVQVKARTRTISTRRVTISKTCTFRTTVVFRDRSRFRGASSLKFTARFAGNTALERRNATVKTARIR